MSILDSRDATFHSIESFGHSRSFTSAARLIYKRVFIWSALAAGDLGAIAISEQISKFAISVIGLNDDAANAPLPALTTIALFAVLGLYVRWGVSPVQRLRIRALGIAIFLTVSLSMIAVTQSSLAVTVHIMMTATLLFILGHYTELCLRRALVRWNLWGVPTILVGSHSNHDLASALLDQPDFGLKPIGIICEQAGSSTGDMPTRIPFLRHVGDFRRLEQVAEVALIVRENEAVSVNLSGLPLENSILVHNRELGRGIGLYANGSCDTIGTDIRSKIYKRQSLFFKRSFDLVLSIPIALVALPVILLLTCVIRAVDPGPGLFWQKRVGQNGRTINICKLRTMYVDAEQRLLDHFAKCPEAYDEWNKNFKLVSDPRILPFVGNIIRRSSLDELPQIFNVLLGDISLVGPRPFPEYHHKGFSKAFQNVRTSVPPGLTGFWQISARSDGDLSVQEKQDTLYIQNWSIWLDIWILLQTLPAVVAGKGAR